MNILFVPTTTLSLINVINLVYTKQFINSNNYLAIMARDKVMLNALNIIEDKRLFKRVVAFSFFNNKNFFFKILIFLFPFLMLSKKLMIKGESLNFLKNIDVIITTSYFQAILFKKISISSQIILLEEGISSYTGRVVNFDRRNIITKFFFRKYIKKDPIFLYCPNLYCGKDREIYKIPRLTKKVILLLSEIFHHTQPYNIKNSITYLGVPFWGLQDLAENPSKVDINFIQECKRILKYIYSTHKRKILYRKHPIELEPELENMIDMDDSKENWELSIGFNNNCDFTIISFFSTGMLTPYLMFGFQPKLIFLYNLLDFDFLEADRIVDKLRLLYNDPNRIMTPSTYDELDESLISISEINND